MKYILILLVLGACSSIMLPNKSNEELLVQAQTNKVCINQDTCFNIKTHISLTTNHLYVSDNIGNKITTNVIFYQKSGEEVLVKTTNDNLNLDAYFKIDKIYLNYQFHSKQYILVYNVIKIDKNYLILFK